MRTRPRARCAGSKPASHPSGTPRLPSIGLLDAGEPADSPAVRARRRLAARRRGHGGRRLGGAPAGPGARWLGFRVRQRPVPGHRRHRRGRARAAPGGPPRPRSACAPRSIAPGPGLSACSPRTAAGAPSTPTTRANWPTSCRSVTSGRSIDPPSADVTAHVVEFLARGRARRRRGLPRRSGVAAAPPGG